MNSNSTEAQRIATEKAQEVSKLLETPEQFRRWLLDGKLAESERKHCGIACHSGKCPIASFILDNVDGICYVDTAEDDTRVYVEYESEYNSTLRHTGTIAYHPDWVQQFIGDIDNAYNHAEVPVDAATALRVLRNTREEINV